MPAHPKPSALKSARPVKASVAFGYMAAFTDEQLDAHIGHLDSWLGFQAEEMEAALNERERRGGAQYALTPMAEAWLAANAGRLEALL